jgi:hypothetical protein
MNKQRGRILTSAGKIERGLIIGISLAFTVMSFPACKRSSPSGTSASAVAAPAGGGDGCVDTNPRPEIASACAACLKRNAQSAGKDGCCGVTDSIGLQLCQAVSTCMRAGGPPVGQCNLGGDTTTCFCGKHQADCDIADKANGPCVAQITAAAGRNIDTHTTDTPNAAQVLTRYGETQYALGRAANIAAIAGAFCKAECGLGM